MVKHEVANEQTRERNVSGRETVFWECWQSSEVLECKQREEEEREKGEGKERRERGKIRQMIYLHGR